MAYPFIQWPTFGDFRQRLIDEFDCDYDTIGTINGTAIGCLRRTIDGEDRRYGVTFDDHDRLAPTVIRSICHRLSINVKHFGFTLE